MQEMRSVPVKTYHGARAKISDGKSIVVTVPPNTKIENAQFYVLEGYFGAAFGSVETKAGEQAELTLNIEQAEYETDQLKSGNEFEKGAIVYFDEEAKVFTVEEEGNRKVGRVSEAKDANGVILFILGPQI
ncbi:hypothetical protein AJ85_05685 [Alkalihalobacillus alcalophilus ATCC 27647 = CGMCC 1.3604]|uniref:DUF2190 family protein n=1 Tax=Alkalihalobacillus alcalophilus ATCC 27647 = CGMCC 1.3604 TaxID=1218173 RepID=A0A4S4K144_ALKAL|nr:DUF2190 family protein [Alkalihalobacillus alcalophilus]YP_009276835.1 head decoration [Bacillus phage BalMu-1]AJA42463.1 hypothetical protein BalMu1_A29 [Bacillus phage BalMu-1]MED1561150.1 DUF2190 family protein [Alkalihalobacillus alcalophilus]THG91314.1 hypothetical protein AJ85_05685 [Alkalihalobacillus alcalophilus ATCC 27647 = CGMCC 1.3604]